MAPASRSTTKASAAEAPTSAGTWDETHQRVTFHCPLSVLAAIEVEMRRSGRSKSRVIADALREAFGDEQ